MADKKRVTIPDDADRSVVQVYRNWENAQEYHARRTRRSIENWRMYWAHDPELGLGQWPEKVASRMVAEQRQLTQYNITNTLVDTIAGGIMKSPFHPKYYPVNDQITSLTRAITQASYSDKELMDWDAAFFEMIRAGLIQEGVVKIGISTEFSRLGNIKFESCLPNSVFHDPNWRTWSSKDCRRCWKETWMEAEVAAEIYPKHRALFEAEIERTNRFGPEYGPNEGVTAYSNTSDNRWGSQLRFIEQYEMKAIKKTIEYVVTVDKKTRQAREEVIPDNLNSPAEKIAWLNENVPDWQPDYVFEREVMEQRCFVTTIAPDISWNIVIEHGETEIQIGRLPFFWWAASRANGESRSIVDSIKDAQQTLNYWESMITYKLQIEGGGGAQLVDPSKFKDNNEAQRYKKDRNNPAESFEVKPNALEGGASQIADGVYKSTFPNEVYQHLNHIIDVLIPYISKVNPSVRGQKEGPSDSGRLFELMKIQSDQQLYTIHYGLRILYNEIYEAYLMQASRTYAAERLPRVFGVDGGKEKVILNERIELPDGSILIKNDTSRLKDIRHKVIVSESEASPTQRLADLRSISQLLQSIDPNAKPATMSYLINKATGLVDIMDNDEDQAELKRIGDKEVALAIERIDSEIAKLQAERMKAEEGIKAYKQRSATGGQPPEAIPPVPGAPQGVQEQTELPPQAAEGPQVPAAEAEPINGPQAQGVEQ